MKGRQILESILCNELQMIFWKIPIEVKDKNLLYLSVSTRAMIGQFCGPYITVRPATARYI